MSVLPSKRVLVYVAVGLVVLVVGIIGLVAARHGSGSGTGAVIQEGDTGSSGSVLLSGGSDTTQVATSTTEVPQIWVQVAGAVHLPGVYHLQAGSRVFEAVAAAGGFAADADQQAVAQAAQLSDGCRVYVPKAGETAPSVLVSPAQSTAGISGGPAGSGSSGGPVSLNSATAEQLDTLPGIGPSLAKQIIAYRETKGPFTSIDQLTNVPGIGPAKLAQIRPLVVL